jgi:hypothetical protein
MPDFFSGVLPLAMFLLAVGGPNLRPVERSLLFALITVGIGSHLSHFVLVAVAAAAMALACARWRTGTPTGPQGSAAGGSTDGEGAALRRSEPVPRVRLLAIVAAIGVAGVVVAATNQLTYGRFVLSPGGHAFLLARLLADGPAARHLHRACPGAGYRLCAHLDELPRTENDYLWNGTLLARTGGWLGSREESTTIIARTLAEEPLAVLGNAAVATARQLAANGTWWQLQRIPDGHGAAYELARAYPADVATFRRSQQQQGALRSLPFDVHSWILRLDFWVLAAVAGALAWRARRVQPLVVPLFACCVAFVVANALVCGALSSVSHRYQARVTWPVVFVGLALLAAHERRPRRAPEEKPSAGNARAA